MVDFPTSHISFRGGTSGSFMPQLGKSNQPSHTTSRNVWTSLQQVIPPGKDRWRSPLPLVLLYHGPKNQIATKLGSGDRHLQSSRCDYKTGTTGDLSLWQENARFMSHQNLSQKNICDDQTITTLPEINSKIS